MTFSYKSFISGLALSFLAACQIVNVQVETEINDDSTVAGELPDTSSFGPDWEPTTTGDMDSTSGEVDATTGSTGSETGSSEGHGDDSSSSTGPGLPVDDSCDFSRACEVGVCSPTGECVNACDNDGRCVGSELCLAGACVEVGSDMMEAQLVAFNDSPAGAVSSNDIDVWKVQMPHPGLFNVVVAGMPVTAYVLNGMGEVLASPDDAEGLGNEGTMFSYPAEIDDIDLPMVVLLMTSSADPVPYYFYTIALEP